MNDLLKQLKESGVIARPEILKNDLHNPKVRIEDVFSGTWDYTESGEIFTMDEIIKYGSLHGNIKISNEFDPSKVFNVEDIDCDSPLTIKDIAFLDIETSSLSFGAGSFVFLIGICYFTVDGLKTKLLFIDTPSNEPAIISRVDSELSRFPVIISFNGKSFDMPFLKNRSKFHHLAFEISRKQHIDLLFLSRKLWKVRLGSCKLSEIEKEILGLKRDSSEIPGWLVPQIYFDFLSQRDPNLLKGVFYHNKIDVISLAALFQYISEILQIPKVKSRIDSRDFFSLAAMYEKKKDVESAIKFYNLGFQTASQTEVSAEHFRLFGLLHKRNKDLIDALINWEIAANLGDIIACIELAKYFEHKNKDFRKSLEWAKRAKVLINKSLTSEKKTVSLEKIDHRIKRIKRKKIKYEKQKP